MLLGIPQRVVQDATPNPAELPELRAFCYPMISSAIPSRLSQAVAAT
jgi:hypothetical protein